ncbi:MAG: type II secretion system protein N [Woeseiaceae bacterium]
MKRYIIAGLIVFLAVLVTTFPARVAYKQFAPPDLSLTGISGSIWKGSAAEGLAGGAYLRNLTWKIKPASILTGQLAYQVSAQPAAGQIDTNVAVGLDGALTLSALTGSVPLDLVHEAFQQAGIGGDLSLDFARLEMRNGLPADVEGSVTVTNFFVPNLSSAQLGDYRADFYTDNGTVMGDVADTSGVLEVNGVVTLAPDRSYSLIGNVGARPEAPPSVTRQLEFLGSPDEKGMRPFRFEGSL